MGEVTEEAIKNLACIAGLSSPHCPLTIKRGSINNSKINLIQIENLSTNS
jgi:hypothetical protein